MPRDKRKTRLEKGSGEFVGFGAFAASPTETPSVVGFAQPSKPLQQQWSPVYTGSEQRLHLIFRRIAQKRDGITKARALGELREYFEKQDVSKKDQVAALSHLLFIYHSKLGYDDFSSVRAASIQCLHAAYERLPKAWTSMVMEQRGGEVWGGLWCAQTDATTEVRSAAESCCQLVQDGESSPDHVGVVQYVSRLLGYERPRNLHEALFARKTSNETQSKQTSLSESERDQLEERFDRIVGAALAGMELWIRQHPNTDYRDCFRDEILWKTLSSSRSSFRRKTYSLLAIACQNAKSLVYASGNLPMALTNLLTIERDAANVPSLFEVLLLYMTNFPETLVWETLDATLITKNLCKILKKACHGATASQWGPTMLPLLVALPDSALALQRQILASMWSGGENAITTSDGLSIVAAIAECSSFFLLRKQISPLEAPVAQEVAKLWLITLDYYLSRESLSSSAIGADQGLLQSLGRGFSLLDTSSTGRPQSAIYDIQTWFWSESVPSTMKAHRGSRVDHRLSLLLRHVLKLRTQSQSRVLDTGRSLLNPIVRDEFHSTLTRYQGDSGSVPDVHGYELLITCMEFCGAEYAFDAMQESRHSTMDGFIINDLLRWLVIHTSSHSSQGFTSERDSLVRKAFTLLHMFLTIALQQRRTLWESIVREIVAAECDLEPFAAGLAILAEASDDPAWAGMLRCNSLQAFVSGIGLDAVAQHYAYNYRLAYEEIEEEDRQRDQYSADTTKIAMFLRTCVGLEAEPSLVFVQKRVVDTWIDSLFQERNDPAISLGGHTSIDNVLLMTVISLVENESPLVDSESTSKIMITAWRHGGRSWNAHALAWLVESHPRLPLISQMLVLHATKELRGMLEAFSLSQDRIETVLSCHVWSERASRILDLQHRLNEGATSECPFLESVGLADLAQWEQAVSTGAGFAVEFRYLCLSYLLEQTDLETKRVELFGELPSSLVVKMFVAMSDVSESSVIDPLRRQDRRVRHILALFDRVRLRESGVLEGWCRATVMALKDSMRVGTGIDGCMSVQSEILGVLFDRVAAKRELPHAEDIYEGQMVWYVTDPADENDRELAVVAKVHTDDFPRLYFTVLLDSGGEHPERQTVPSRLRLSQSSDELQDSTEKGQRQLISTLMTNQLLKSHLDLPLEAGGNLATTAEVINMVVSQSGLYEKAGIGSIQYDIFRWLKSLETKVLDALGSNDVSDELVLSLRALSLAMGYGHVSPVSTLNFNLLGFSAERMTAAIFDYFEERHHQDISVSGLDRSILQWLSVALSHLKDNDLRARSNWLTFKLATRLLCTGGSASVENNVHTSTTNALLAMRAVQSVLLVDFTGGNEADVALLEGNVFLALVREFACSWSSAAQPALLTCMPYTHEQEPLWAAAFDDFLCIALVHKKDRIGAAASSSSEELARLLFDRNKRWFAFRMLDAAACTGKPVYMEDECEISESTLERQKSWGHDLEEEEKEELASDIFVVSQWIPHSLMEELEQWADNESPIVDEHDSIGRMLSWLSLLSFVESSANADALNRGSFSVYVDKCQAAATTLDLTLSHIDFGTDRKAARMDLSTVDKIREDKASMNLTMLPALVLFRTAEVFPSLFKRWWEHNCTRAMSSAVLHFVETNVAPAILSRDLNRIMSANLGEMTVSGSAMTREVTATYMQDECKLSVTISIPPSFPLRNVEVDSSRTLGVADKRLKRWALQIRLMLNNQDGSLLDALMLWKQNVDQEFAGVEPCVICYSVLSVKTHELPNLECKTCSNVFHSSCLHKWFHSSGKSQCVVCQQPWSGSRIH